MDKLKLIFLKPTNTLPFMLGLFIGMTIFDPNVLSNSIITAMSGTTYHAVKAIFSFPG